MGEGFKFYAGLCTLGEAELAMGENEMIWVLGESL